jgi:adenylate kinase
MHEYIAQPGASGGLAGASNTLKSNQPTANSIQRLTHRNPDTPKLLELSTGIQLLDGHFALRSTAGKIECISVTVFEQLGIQHVVCIRDAPSSILARLTQRDGYSGSIEEVAALQEAELEHADVVAEHLGVQLHAMSAFDAVSLELLLRRAMVEHGT